MNSINRFLYISYLILAFVWFIVGGFSFIFLWSGYHKNVWTASLGIMIGLGILLFSYIHKNVSDSTLETFNGKSLIISSVINAVILALCEFLLLLYVALGVECGECAGGFALYFLIGPLAIVFSFITILLTITLHLNKRISFWIFFLIIISIIFLYTMTMTLI